jgi:predicted Na+-dependent transporter
MSKARRAKPDWFMIALPLVALAACLWPAPGVTGGPLHWDWISTYGVSVVFFLYGLTLAPEKMRAGASHWRLHLVATAGTFILFPALVLGAGAVGEDWIQPELLLGFFFLAVLPSTISSSVAMTSLARGNLPASIFNATLSSLIGVLITPLLMAWYTHSQGVPMPLGPVLLKVALLVVLPIVLGQLVRPLLAAWANRHYARIKMADRVIILAIVYGSFADSMASGIWSQQDPCAAGPADVRRHAAARPGAGTGDGVPLLPADGGQRHRRPPRRPPDDGCRGAGGDEEGQGGDAGARPDGQGRLSRPLGLDRDDRGRGAEDRLGGYRVRRSSSPPCHCRA